MLIGMRKVGLSGGSPIAAAAFGNCLAFLLALPGAWPIGSHSLKGWTIILFLGVVQISLAYILLARAVTHVPAFETSLLLFAEPALNPIFSWIVHGERPGVFSLLGGAILLGTTGLKAWWDSRQNSKTKAATDFTD
jgi:drug/metabolite transporter (DMT)-like permease